MKKLMLFAAAALIMISFSDSWAIEKGNSKTDETVFKWDQIDTPVSVIKAYPPTYPLNARMKVIEGRVVLQVVVTKEGVAKNIEILESIPSGVFDECCIKAASKYRFSPGIKDGVPVNSIVKLPIVFELEDTVSGYDFYTLYEKGLKHMEDGEYQDAIDPLSEAIDIYKRFSPAYYLRGLAYTVTGEDKRAVSDFKKAIKLDPEEGKYYYERGKLFISLEKYDKAIEDLSKTIELYPDLTDAYNNRGDAFRLSGQYENAIMDYSDVVRMDDQNVQAYNNRGYSYNKLKDTENTCRDMQKACELGDCRGLEILQKAGACSAQKG